MGYGTRIRIAILDSSKHGITEIEQIEKSVQTDDMNRFDLKKIQILTNNSDSDYQYCEFKLLHNGSGKIKFRIGKQFKPNFGKLTIEIVQEAHFAKSNKHHAVFQLECQDKSISLLTDNEGFKRLIFPDFNDGKLDTNINQKLQGMPPHWSKDDIEPKGCLEIKLVSTEDAILPVKNFTFLCSHNSFVNPQNGYILCQQDLSIEKQMHSGVRALMLDTYVHDGKIVLSHLKPNSAANVLQRLSTKSHPTLKGTLETIAKFLKEHPDDFIFIFFEDETFAEVSKENHSKIYNLWREELHPFKDILYCAKSDNAQKFDMIDYIFNSNDSIFSIATNKDLRGKIALFSSSRSSKHVVPNIWKHCLETVYSNESLDANLKKSMKQRAEAIAENNNNKNLPFLIVNHFPSIDIFDAIRSYGLLFSGIVGIFTGRIGYFAAAFLSTSAIGYYADSRIKKRDSANKLIEKAEWANKEGDALEGHYNKYPNFYAIDYINKSDALQAINHFNKKMVDDIIDMERNIFPIEIDLGILGLTPDDRPIAILHYVDGSKPNQPLIISDNILHIDKPSEENFNFNICSVNVANNNHKYSNVINLVRSTSNSDHNKGFWKLNFNRFHIRLDEYPEIVDSKLVCVRHEDGSHAFRQRLTIICEQDRSYILLERKSFNFGDEDLIVVGITDSGTEIVLASFRKDLNNFTLIPKIDSYKGKPTNTHYTHLQGTLERVANILGYDIFSSLREGFDSEIILPFPVPDLIIDTKSTSEDNFLEPNILFYLEETHTNLSFNLMALTIDTSVLIEDKIYSVRFINSQKINKQLLRFSFKEYKGKPLINFLKYEF